MSADYRAQCGCGAEIEGDTVDDVTASLLKHMREEHGVEAKPAMTVNLDVGRDAEGRWVAAITLPNGNTVHRYLSVAPTASKEEAVNAAALLGQQLSQDPSVMGVSPN